jgi:quercetin dioxygenase-like cupin family protein
LKSLDVDAAFVQLLASGAVEDHSWGRIVWLASGRLNPGSDQTLGYVEIDAGHKNYRHSHPNCEEVLFLLQGSLDHRVGDEKIHLEPGDTLVIPTGIVHEATNTSGSVARIIVAYPTGHRAIQLAPEDGPIPMETE